MKAKCWLIGEPDRALSGYLEAARRSLPVQSCLEGAVADIPAKPGVLIAVDFDNFQCLAPSARVSLRERIMAGATCYIGGSWVGKQYSLAPLAPAVFDVVQAESPTHTFTDHPLLPAVLRGESIEHSSNISLARGLPELAQALALARTGDGSMAATLFAIKLGAGVIICDLIARTQIGDMSNDAPSLLRLLENPFSRLEIIGPLVAVDRALGHDTGRPIGCDIVLDDRPINLDYFNISKLRDFVSYLTDRCPGIHIDFGWTPDQNRPSRRYVEAIKEFNAGFVWHGLLHHVDHSAIVKPELHFEHGLRLVKEISKRYRVRFQPVMVFPYEKDSADCVALLKREGFIAKAETTEDVTAGTSSSRESGVTRPPETVSDDAGSGFALLARDSVETVTRDRMLARAVLGMPIIAAVHPRNVGLRRFAKVRHCAGGGHCLDEVLEFIVAKRLRPHSLEELAQVGLAAAADAA